MAITKRDIKLSRKRREQNLRKRPIRIWAETFLVNGSVHPDGRKNFLYVKELGQSESQRVVQTDIPIDIAGVPVVVEMDEERGVGGKVIELYTGIMSPRDSHRVASRVVDKKVYQPSIMMLKTLADGATLVVKVFPHKYTSNGKRRWFPGTTIDLTSYVPSTSSRAVRVLIYLNDSSGVIGIRAGAEVLTTGSVLPPYPNGNAGEIMSAWIYLFNGQTAITHADHVDDARTFMQPTAESSQFASGTDGQILISDSGEYAPKTPMLDQYGGHMIDQDGSFMYESV